MNNLFKHIFLCMVMASFLPMYADDNKLYTDPRVQISLPSTEAQSLGKFSEIPVDLYTGRTNINIPLFTIKHNDIEVPISLSYHGGGIKVDDDAGLVGLGWTLNAGGVVSRIVRGLPDDLYNSYDRGIAAIRYNLLNLPDTIQFTNGNQIVHRYDAAGNRLTTNYYTRKVATTVPLGNTLTGTFNTNNYHISREAFHNNCVYTANNRDLFGIEFVHNSEGYIRYYGPNEHYHFYYIKDLLGNIRETYVHPEAGYKECIQRMQYYPSGLPWAETAGASEQPWKYNSKEFVEMHGLDEYDSKARWYYPAICRTTTIDPLAEKYYPTSPYAWCGNNPVRFVDPDGMDWYMDEDSTIVWTDYGTQQEMDDNGVKGTYLGEAYVEIKGSYSEKVGSDNTLSAHDAHPAEVIIYGINGEDDISTYNGLTITSDPERYSMIEEGDYRLKQEQMATSIFAKEDLTYRIYTLDNSGYLPTADGETNKNNPSQGPIITDAFMHRTNNNGNAIGNPKNGHPVSAACIVIDARSWRGVERQLGKSQSIFLRLSRTR